MNLLKENSNMRHNDCAPLFDRLIAAGSYLTLGTIGIIWLLISAVVIKRPMGGFLTCNLIQSFVLSIFYAIFSLAYNIFIGILISLPFAGKMFLKLHIFLFEAPIFSTMSFINYILLLFVCYLSVIALFGKLPFVPYITDIAKKLKG